MSMTDDRELERYLQRKDALSRAYGELKSERPTPALDQAVLKQARAALQAQPRKHSTHFRASPALAAIAATVVLSFALVMRVVLEPEIPREDSPVAPVPSATSAYDASAPKALEDHETLRAEPVATLATPQASTPAPSSIENSRPVIEAEIRATAAQAPAIAEPALQQSVPQASRDKQAKQAPGEFAVAPGVIAAPARESARERASASSLPTESQYNDQPETPAARKAPLKPPQEWLEEIERLRAAGDSETADRELALFKKAYPGYIDQQASPADR